MKILSWNVAGIRAVLRKNALDFTLNSDYDILCFQETKAEQQQVKNISKFTDIYHNQYWNHSKTKKGYSGTAIATVTVTKGKILVCPTYNITIVNV